MQISQARPREGFFFYQQGHLRPDGTKDKYAAGFLPVESFNYDPPLKRFFCHCIPHRDAPARGILSTPYFNSATCGWRSRSRLKLAASSDTPTTLRNPLTPLQNFGPYCLNVSLTKKMLTQLARVIRYRPCKVYELQVAISQGESRRVKDKNEKFVDLCPTLGCFSGIKPIELLAFLADLKADFDACEASGAKRIRVFTYLLADSVKAVFEVYTDPGSGTGAAHNQGTWLSSFPL